MSCLSFRFVPSLAAALILALPVAAAQAQTCGLPLPIEIPDPTVPFAHGGDTCVSGNLIPYFHGIGCRIATTSISSAPVAAAASPARLRLPAFRS